MPLHEDTLGLANHRVAGQFLRRQVVAPTLLSCLLPVLQVAPGQPSLHTPKLLTCSSRHNS